MTTSIALTLLILTATIATTIHIPFRGRSLRDRLRPAAEPPSIGLRVTPGTKAHLAAADIVAMVNDSPSPIAWFGIHLVQPEPGDEIAHRYQAIARSFGVNSSPWAHIAVAVTDPTQHDQVQAFLQHRLGLLGLRPRLLDAAELADTARTPPTVVLSRPVGRNHTRRPHLWFTQAKSVTVPMPPKQIVGVSTHGKALTIRLGDFQHTRLHTETNPSSQLAELLLPTLVLGYRVGIYTHRPTLFSELLDAGATLLGDTQSETVDLVLHDAMTASAQQFTITTAPHPLAHTTVGAPAAGSNSVRRDVDKRGLPIPHLTLGRHQWTLAMAEHATGVRPITVRALANKEYASNKY